MAHTSRTVALFEVEVDVTTNPFVMPDQTSQCVPEFASSFASRSFNLPHHPKGPRTQIMRLWAPDGT